MRYKTVREGSVIIRIPEARIPEEGEVFYNPEMVFDRNISVAVAAVAERFIEIPKNKIRACDLLAATGVRALRYAREAGLRVTANDASKKAVALIKENARQNKIKIKITNLNANVLLTQHFDLIDIDPFGSPINFVDSAVNSFSFRGLLACTATDLGPLVGSYQEVCLRRYGLRSMFTDYNRELGVRILITAIMRRFFQREKTFVPLLTYARRHYFRVFGLVRYGNKNVNRALRDFGYVSHCFSCGWRSLGLYQKCGDCKNKTEFCGELCLGDIQNAQFCEAVAKELWRRGWGQEAHLVKSVHDEVPFPFYYDIHDISKRLQVSPPSLARVTKMLSEKGYSCSRTHFSGTGIKTNAGFADVVKALKGAGKKD